MADEKETPTDEQKPEGDKAPDTSKEPTKEPDKGKPDSSSGDDHLRSLIAEEVRKALEGVAPKGSTLPTPRARDIEEEAKRMVREAAEKLEAEKAHENEHKQLAEKAKDLAEDAPKKVRRLTKALWGDQE